MASLLSGDNANSVHMKTLVQIGVCTLSCLLLTCTHTVDVQYKICVCTICNAAYVSDPSPLEYVHVVRFSSGNSFHLSMNCHSFSPAALYKHSHLLTFTSSFNNKTSRNNIFIDEERQKTGGRNKCCGINGAKNCFY